MVRCIKFCSIARTKGVPRFESLFCKCVFRCSRVGHVVLPKRIHMSARPEIAHRRRCLKTISSSGTACPRPGSDCHAPSLWIVSGRIKVPIRTKEDSLAEKGTDNVSIITVY